MGDRLHHLQRTHKDTTMQALRTSTTGVFRSAVASSSKARLAAIGQRNYHENVISHFEKPRNVGSFPKGDLDVGTGLVGAPACGDVMKLQIKVHKDGKTIERAVFKTFGCGSAIATSSYATELITGMCIDDAAEIKNTDIANELKLPPVKLHCSMLAEDAIKAAIKDYKSRRNEHITSKA